jgi:hypothetical protein
MYSNILVQDKNTADERHNEGNSDSDLEDEDNDDGDDVKASNMLPLLSFEILISCTSPDNRSDHACRSSRHACWAVYPSWCNHLGGIARTTGSHGASF